MLLLFILIMNQGICTKTVQKNDMVFSWTFSGSRLNCSVKAPGHGWVAVGFNDSSELAGTNLIMGAVEDGFYILDDRYIAKPGLHKNVLEFGADEMIKDRFGKEDDLGTTIRFSIPLKAIDKYHHDLTKGKTYYILLAYSLEDDFEHHSIMRTSVKIKL